MWTLLEGGPLLDELKTLPCKGRLTKGDNESWTVILDSSWDEVISGKDTLKMVFRLEHFFLLTKLHLQGEILEP